MAKKHLIIPLFTPQDILRFWCKVDFASPNGCWEWQAKLNSGGYGRFGLERDAFRAHRIAWSMAYGPIPSGLCVCHHCDNPSCVNPAHLFVDSVVGNNADMTRKGRRPCGEQHWIAKLTAKKVRDIRMRYAKGGATLTELGRKYGAHFVTIWDVVHRRTWKHV